jgi:hypothetical protein
MALYDDWKQMCEMAQTPQQQTAYWKEYFDLEKKNYEKILADTSILYEGTVAELAKVFDMDDVVFVGFLDGINTSLKKEINLDKLTSNSKVKLDIDLEKLYYNMLDAKAKWLYELPQWDSILSSEKRNDIRKEWRASKQAVSEKTVGRNDPCPCGSGKKYKKCCGAGK